MPRRQWAISVRRIIEEAQFDIIIARREVRSRWDRKGGIAVEGRVEDAARIGIVDAEAPAARRSQRKIRRSSEIGGPFRRALDPVAPKLRSEEHTSELQSLMRNSYAVFCLKKKKSNKQKTQTQKN